jgi:ubiquinol-cytochrome c reductase cytochrome b subunit
MRLMPGVETRGAGHTVVWDVFIPAVVLPGLLFTGLLFYPFFERWVTGDRGEQHLCDRPRNKPTRTGMGVGGIIWYAVLLLAGGQDVIADVLNVSVNTVNWVLRVSFFLAPLIAFWLTKRLCLALQAHDRQLLTEGEESGEIHQTLEGAFVESHEPLATERAYTLMLRDIPPPLPVSDAARRRARLRAALSAWYYRDRVEFPATPRQRAAIASLTASPGEDVPQLEGTTEGDEVSS